METVQPVRSKRKVRQMFAWLQARNERDGLLWALGTNTGLRVSDLLKLRVKHVRFRGQPREYLVLRDTKTGKATRRLIVAPVQELVSHYCQALQRDRYLFISRVGRNRPITRSRAYQILNEAADACGVEEVGTHTMRKTFGYHHFQQNKDLTLLQDLLNHGSERETRRYIGINQDCMDDSMKGFDLLGADNA